MSFKVPKSEGLSLKEWETSKTFYERIQENYEAIGSNLNSDEYITVHYYGNGGSYLVYDLGYHNPYLLILHCLDSNSQKCTIFVHVYSAELVLVQRSVEEKSEDKPQMGFVGGSGSGVDEE